MPSSPGIITSSTTTSGLRSTRQAKRFVAVAGRHDVESLGLEVAPQEVADARLVVGDQHARLRRTGHAPRR